MQHTLIPFLISITCVFYMTGLQAAEQTPATTQSSATTQPTETIPLWSNGAPGALGNDPVKDVPTLTVYRPAQGSASGAAMVVCPGGGYGHLAEHEGRDYALWLNGQGITGFVLKYRLGTNNYHHPAMMNDVQRAVRLVRARAADWGVDVKRVGVMGSSAGGHLASTAVTHFDAGNADASDPVDRFSSRPDIGILCYPVISMGEYAHAGSKENLLGKEPAAELVTLMSSELQVTKETPPCFLWHTFEDKTVNVQNSLLFASALKQNGVPFDLHVFQRGGHGLGLGVKGYDPAKTDPSKLLPWTRDLSAWLKVQGFIK